MTTVLDIETSSIVPFSGFRGTCWELAYEDALRRLRDEIRDELGDLLWDDGSVIIHDRAAAIAHLSAGYTMRVIGAANRSLGSDFAVKFIEIRDEREIVGELIGCTRRDVFVFATDKVADIVGSEGARLLARRYENTPPLEWLLMSAHMTNLARLPLAELEDEVSIFDKVFSSMERSNAFFAAVAMKTRVVLPALEGARSDRTQADSAPSRSQTIWVALEELKAASGAKT